MRRRQSYFDKRPLLREESFVSKRDFYRPEKVLLEKKTSMRRRKSYFEKRLSIERRFF